MKNRCNATIHLEAVHVAEIVWMPATYLEGISDKGRFFIDDSALFGGSLALSDLLDHFSQL
jgi:hypothetical protein